jgi:TorA maturation chaperone TorD
MTTLASRAELALIAQADLLLAIVRLLSGPARFDDGAPLAAPAELEELARTAGGDGLLVDALRAASAAAATAPRTEWTREQTRLFEGPVACPINETAYVRRDKGAIIGDVCGFYRAFGFEPDQASGEKADHLLCELEFVAVLLLMLARAEHDGDGERAEVVHGAVRSFLSDHLGEWVHLLEARIRLSTALEVMHRSVDLLAPVWDLLAVRFDVPVFAALAIGVADPDDLAREEDGTPYECDLAPPASPFVTLTGPPGHGMPTAEPAGPPADRTTDDR